MSHDESLRVDEVFFSLIHYCFEKRFSDKRNTTESDKELFKAVTERLIDKDSKNTEVKVMNTLTRHMDERFEIKEYVNKFHMIEPISKKQIRNKGGDNFGGTMLMSKEDALARMSKSRQDP